MRRIPIIPTLVVLIAVATMIALGFWQIRRAHWKEALLAQYHAAEGAPLIEGIPPGDDNDALAFRRDHLRCAVATAGLQLGGPSSTGTPGFRHILGCRLDDGRLIMVDLGWAAINAQPVLPPTGAAIEATGRLIPDAVLAGRLTVPGAQTVPLVLVAESTAAGLQPSVPPSAEDVPNNHRGYAVQWFLFAATAAIIYVIALRRRNRSGANA